MIINTTGDTKKLRETFVSKTDLEEALEDLDVDTSEFATKTELNAKADLDSNTGYIVSSQLPFPLSTANGGTGNSVGYIQTGKRSNTTAGMGCTIEGLSNTVTGQYCHVEGANNTAIEKFCHVEGLGNVASGKNQHVFGTFNTSISNVVELVGNGTSASATSNARVLDWNGNETLAGKLTVGVIGENDYDVAVQSQINELKSSVSSGKSLIAAAVTDKGVTTAATDSFSTMATNISNIQSGGGNYLPFYIPTATSTGSNSKSLTFSLTSNQYPRNVDLSNYIICGIALNVVPSMYITFASGYISDKNLLSMTAEMQTGTLYNLGTSFTTSCEIRCLIVSNASSSYRAIQKLSNASFVYTYNSNGNHTFAVTQDDYTFCTQSQKLVIFGYVKS